MAVHGGMWIKYAHCSAKRALGAGLFFDKSPKHLVPALHYVFLGFSVMQSLYITVCIICIYILDDIYFSYIQRKRRKVRKLKIDGGT